MKPRSMRSMRWRFTPARRTCPPIMRIRAALVVRAWWRRAAMAARSGCLEGGGAASSGNQRSKCRAWARSAIGVIRSFERLAGYERAAGKVEAEAAGAEGLKESPRAGNQVAVGRTRTGLEVPNAGAGDRGQARLEVLHI